MIKNANLLGKGLTENGEFDFKSLIPKPYPAWSTGATVAVQGCRMLLKHPIWVLS
ncbi:MAG: hypothetical protein PHH67_01395 [Methanosarcina sp.]|nr:hypothetical protein [Methanosarcina sp.]